MKAGEPQQIRRLFRFGAGELLERVRWASSLFTTLPPGVSRHTCFPADATSGEMRLDARCDRGEAKRSNSRFVDAHASSGKAMCVDIQV
eukprot:2496058-Rhodomonas_salina.2